MKINTIEIIKLEPSKGVHLKNIKGNFIAECIIRLGKFDSADNYVEVTEEEYQEYLKAQEEAHKVPEVNI